MRCQNDSTRTLPSTCINICKVNFNENPKALQNEFLIPTQDVLSVYFWFLFHNPLILNSLKSLRLSLSCDRRTTASSGSGGRRGHPPHPCKICHPRLHSRRMRTACLLTVSQHALRRGVSAGGYGRPPPVNRMTDRCKNITLPQLRCRRQQK